jgi:hypothetical protein
MAPTPTRHGRLKRLALIPPGHSRIFEKLSKADLAEIAWSLASLSNGVSADDDELTAQRLLEEANALRINQGRRPLRP